MTSEPIPLKWLLVTDGIATPPEPLWQHADNPHAWSLDGGLTYYLTNEPVNADGSPRMYDSDLKPVEEHTDDPLTTLVFQTIGAASMTFQTDDGVFDSERAKQLGDNLVAWINENYVKKENNGAQL